jgi:hypothetical protein
VVDFKWSVVWPGLTVLPRPVTLSGEDWLFTHDLVDPSAESVKTVVSICVDLNQSALHLEPTHPIVFFFFLFVKRMFLSGVM